MVHIGRRAKKKQSNQLIIGFVVIIFAVVAIAGVGIFMLNRDKPLDKVTLCPADGPKGHFVLLVDRTDPLSFVQKQSFKVRMQELVERRLPEGFLLSVFALGEDFKENAKPLIELCNPGDSKNTSDYTGNKARVERQFREKFVEKLLTQYELLLGTQPAKTSPIFEMLQLVSINAFRLHDVKGERRLIVMSDMLHNMPQYSMYKGPADYGTFESTDYGRKSQLDLKNVAVEIHYLINFPQLQTKRNLEFWKSFFNGAGARIADVVLLEG